MILIPYDILKFKCKQIHNFAIVEYQYVCFSLYIAGSYYPMVLNPTTTMAKIWKMILSYALRYIIHTEILRSISAGNRDQLKPSKFTFIALLVCLYFYQYARISGILIKICASYLRDFAAIHRKIKSTKQQDGGILLYYEYINNFSLKMSELALPIIFDLLWISAEALCQLENLKYFASSVQYIKMVLFLTYALVRVIRLIYFSETVYVLDLLKTNQLRIDLNRIQLLYVLQITRYAKALIIIDCMICQMLQIFANPPIIHANINFLSEFYGLNLNQENLDNYRRHRYRNSSNILGVISPEFLGHLSLFFGLCYLTGYVHAPNNVGIRNELYIAIFHWYFALTTPVYPI